MSARPEPALLAASEGLKARRFAAVLQLLDGASPAVAASPQAAFLRALAETRLGRIDAACARLRPLAEGPEPLATEAALGLADALHLGQRHDELAALLAGSPAWLSSPRGELFAARALARHDPAQAAARLQAVFESPAEANVRRLAGFEAAGLLDRMGEYRRAYALAQGVHAATTPPFPLAEMLASLRQQRQLAGKGAQWCQPRAAAIERSAFIVGLPRSGTTLLEQMLDSHPGITGIGEHEGLGELQAGLVEAGVWPHRIKHLDAARAQALQAQYLAGARLRSATSEGWTLDKSLLGWMSLPIIATLLPGAVCLCIERDPRDMAISAMLSYFDPLAFGWTASLASIRQVVQAERELVPQALQSLGLAHERLVYEDLVAAPEPAMQRVLARLGLPMDARVLAPQDNRRTATTLSHAQVSRPINDRSIGRWRHYDFAFEAEWPEAG